MAYCYIFDIDGTIANNSHRTHHVQKTPKDWASYHALADRDAVYEHIRAVCFALQERGDYILFCTGRHEAQRELTEAWLSRMGLSVRHGLYMRKDGDFRADHIIKLEILSQIRKDGYRPVMAFDDRNTVVKMWRDAGIPCAQVAEGDF